MSDCVKVKRAKCLHTPKCIYANGKTRKYCRKSGKKTCRGKSMKRCKNLAKCLYTKGSRRYCKKRRTMKK